MKINFLISFGILFLLINNQGFGDVIYQTAAPNPSEVWSIRWRCSSLNSSSIGVAALFPVPVGMSYRLDSVTLPLVHELGATNLEIALFSNSSGTPDLLMETIAANPTSIATTFAMYTFSSSLSPILEGGGAATGSSFNLMTAI